MRSSLSSSDLHFQALCTHHWQGLCERVLAIDLEAFGPHELPTLVVRDLRESEDHADRLYVRESELKFYAGAPLLSPTGAIVGSLCILDDTPRPDGLSEQHRHSLWDVAQSVMDYLHTCKYSPSENSPYTYTNSIR